MGRIAAKAGDFVDYCKKAFEKIGLEAKLTDEDIESFGIEMEAEFGRKLNAFYQFRSLFANCVENLILIDRLLFLREQVRLLQFVVIIFVRDYFFVFS